MLHINGLSYRLGERLLIDNASAALPSGARVGLVGRNGAGKTTLFRLIRGEIEPEAGSISIPKLSRIGSVEQEAPGGERSDADRRNPDAAGGHRRARRAGPRGAHSRRSRLRRSGAEPHAF